MSLKRKRDLSPKRINLDRREHLERLIFEFQTSSSKDAKVQVLANLVNFAYDPLNYEHFRLLNISDLFLENIFKDDEKIVEISAAGLCNLCFDCFQRRNILKGRFSEIKEFLSHSNEGVILSVLTLLMFSLNPDSEAEINDLKTVKLMIKLSSHQNCRIKNLANIYLQDYCAEELVLKASEEP